MNNAHVVPPPPTILFFSFYFLYSLQPILQLPDGAAAVIHDLYDRASDFFCFCFIYFFTFLPPPLRVQTAVIKNINLPLQTAAAESKNKKTIQRRPIYRLRLIYSRANKGERIYHAHGFCSVIRNISYPGARGRTTLLGYERDFCTFTNHV